MNGEEWTDLYLEHHGVKGMKWGVVNKDKTGSDLTPGAKEYLKADDVPVLNKEQQAKAKKENEAKFKAKFESPKGKTSSGDKEGFHITKKEVAIGVGALAVAGIAGYAIYKTKSGGGFGPKSLSEAEGLLNPGKKVDLDSFDSLVQLSKTGTWHQNDYLKASAFARKEFTLPEGHTFYRLSHAVEDGFTKSGTYTVHSKEDLDRYISVFRHEKGFNADLIVNSFKSTGPVKVPDLETTLNTLRTSSLKSGKPISKKQAMGLYKAWSGGGWNTPRQRRFLSDLSKKGYGAIVDEMDAGVIGETPLVFLRQQVTGRSSTPLTPAMIKRAESSLKEIAGRKLPNPDQFPLQSTIETLKSITGPVKGKAPKKPKVASFLNEANKAALGINHSGGGMNGAEWTEIYLEHHGVKGMKWGVINKDRGGGKVGGSQEEAVIQLAALAAVAAALAVQHTLSSGNTRRIMAKGKAFLTLKHKEIPWNHKPGLADKNMSVDDIMHKVVKPINPKYPNGYGTKMNCRRATYCYEMRRRGYDVTATRTHLATGQDESGSYNAQHPGINLVPPGQSGKAVRRGFEKFHRKSNRPFTDFTNKGKKDPVLQYGHNNIPPHQLYSHLNKQPHGSRGEVGIVWLHGGGHSVAYENVKGKAVIIDTQSGKKYSSQHEFDAFFGAALAGTATTRLDNVPLNHDFLRRWAKNA